MAGQTPLEIHFHLTNGSIARFSQHGPSEVQALLEHAQPSRVFSQKMIVMAGSYSLSGFPCAEVARIDLVMEDFPKWPFLYNARDVEEITEQEFHQRYQPEITHERRTERLVVPGHEATTWGALELSNGEKLWMEVVVETAESTPLDRHQFLQQFLSAPCLHMRRRGGGVVLVNPSNIVSFAFFPGPKETPLGAWNGQFIRNQAGLE